MTRPPLLASIVDAAAACGVSRATFIRHAYHQIPKVRIGGRVLFAWDDIRAWIETQKEAPRSRP